MTALESSTAAVGPMVKIEGGIRASYVCELSAVAKKTRVKIVRRRRKTMAIHVEKAVMTELRVPIMCAWHDIDNFLKSRVNWILEAEDQMARTYRRPADDYSQGGWVSFLGQRYRLILAKSLHSLVDIAGTEIYVSCNAPADPVRVEKRILEWYRAEAEQLFAARIEQLASLFPQPRRPMGFSVRKMKSRWGSCSSRGDICLNLLLIREGLSQIDFVIAHELCHLHHFPHNRAFYSLLDEVMPDWRAREQVLMKS